VQIGSMPALQRDRKKCFSAYDGRQGVHLDQVRFAPPLGPVLECNRLFCDGHHIGRSQSGANSRIHHIGSSCRICGEL
jgi:hypothetical protein